MPALDINDLPAAQRRKERLRHRIIEVARELYLENGSEDGGYENTTVEAIAARADISVRTFFRYFSGKADVIYLDVGRSVEDLLSFVKARLMDEPPVTAALNGALDQIRYFTRDATNRARMLQSLQAPQFRDRLAAKREQEKEQLATLLAPALGKKAASTREARLIATLVRTAVSEAYELWAKDPSLDVEVTVIDWLESLEPIVHVAAAAVKKRLDEPRSNAKKRGQKSA